ncbi:MAG: tRNA 5-methoxyuridine(34)/uridine 5-oxyacetic acid(34) synthase CmoB [Gammaproteobacteria bacterium]|nr:tRNA 5-methoxyuridine(34)/uridine 5-oxyacetic acid(34) synthase CmoB [Gammaproteobacteria bacterium]
MNPYESLYTKLDEMDLSAWSKELQTIISEKLASDGGHGKMTGWKSALTALPDITPSHIELKSDVEIGDATDLLDVDRDKLIDKLKQFHPWRKGPYTFFGIDINTEWRSDWKWDRVLPHIQPLKNRKVLDIGGGNGYHGWRMLGEGADLVLGIDPTLVFVMQYHVMQRYINNDSHYVLPIGIEDLPENLRCFDTVFSMGVLYHRRSPLDHLYELRACLRSGGELVLETLVIEGEEGSVLMPEGRYAKMRNVWFFPSVATMELWLRRCGFKNVSCVDVSTTSLEEQRPTDWMTFESLADFLDPNDKTKTLEGYPAPVRAVFTAIAP